MARARARARAPRLPPAENARQRGGMRQACGGESAAAADQQRAAEHGASALCLRLPATHVARRVLARLACAATMLPRPRDSKSWGCLCC